MRLHAVACGCVSQRLSHVPVYTSSISSPHYLKNTSLNKPTYSPRMRVLVSTRKTILYLRNQRGMTYRQIACVLNKTQGISLSVSAISYWMVRLDVRGLSYFLTDNRPEKARRFLVTDEHLEIIEAAMKENPERSSVDLQRIIAQRTRTTISTSYIRKLRRNLGWTCKRTKYCQLVRDVNKVKRLEWAREKIANSETFDDVIFSDEASFEVQRCTTRTFYKKGMPLTYRPKPKHPVKVGITLKPHGCACLQCMYVLVVIRRGI